MSFFDYIENLSYKIGDYVGRNEDEEDKELYRYSIYSIISQTITFGFGFLLSILFGYVLEYTIVVTSFVSLRSGAGGYLCSKYRDCFFTSNILYLLGCLISLFLYDYSDILFLLSILSGIYILPICPKPSENSPSRGKTEDLRFRKKYSYILMFLIVCNSLSLYFNIYNISSAISSGILITSFIVSDFGESLIDTIWKNKGGD